MVHDNGFFESLVSFAQTEGGGLLLGLGAAGAASAIGNVVGAGQQATAIERAAGLSATESQNIQAILNAQRQEARLDRDLTRQLATGERSEARAQQETLLNIINQIRGEEAPFREAALERTEFGRSFLPTVRESIRSPTLSPGFRLAAREGIERLQRRFAPRGSPSSGPAQVASARFLEGITARELDRFQQNLFSAANIQGALPGSQATQLVGGLGQRLPTAQVAGGLPSAVPQLSQTPDFALLAGQNRAQASGAIGNTLSQLPLLMAFRSQFGQ